jgi:kinetochore complex Sim4 subunit Fta2
MSTAAIDQFDELPRINGPKLRRFRDSHKRIEYLELLGRSDDEDQLPNGDHGYVFKVQIDGKLYALKIVRLGTSTTY